MTTNTEVRLPEFVCLRCGHKWIPRQQTVSSCPKCKSYKWDVPPEPDNMSDVIKQNNESMGMIPGSPVNK